MIEQRVVDFTPGSAVQGRFLVVRKELRQGGRAGLYVDCTLCDATGRVPARIWDNADRLSAQFEVGDVIEVRGAAEVYRGELQLRIERLNPLAPGAADPTDFLPRSKKDPEELRARLTGAWKSLTNPWLQQLLANLFEHPGLLAEFLTAPGAKALHHAYTAGLAEHTVEVLALCERVLEVFPQLDRDLLLTSAILHDLGKLDELSWSTAFEYTDIGHLVGHIVLGERRVYAEMAKIDGFPEDLKLQVSHMILSHHGTKEFGSPVEPMTAEAIALHQAEDLDAKVNLFLGQIKTARGQGRRWTERHFLLGRQLYVGTDDKGGNGGRGA